MENKKKKKKQKKKKGRVFRVDEETQRFIEKNIVTKESIAATIRRLLGLSPKGAPLQEPEAGWTIPSFIFSSRAEAKGEALFKATKEKSEPEEVVEVLKVKS